jgi:hypothetical protein
MDAPRHWWGSRRIAVDVTIGLLALVAAFMFFAAPEGGSPALHGVAAADNMDPPPPPPPPPGNNNGGGNTNSCSCVNGVCSGNACPRSNPPPPPPPPPAGNFGPPPPPRRVTPPPPPPPPAGNFVPDAPAAAAVAPAFSPTAVVSADPPSAGVDDCSTEDASICANTDPKFIAEVADSKTHANAPLRALAILIILLAILFGIAGANLGGLFRYISD